MIYSYAYKYGVLPPGLRDGKPPNIGDTIQWITDTYQGEDGTWYQKDGSGVRDGEIFAGGVGNPVAGDHTLEFADLTGITIAAWNGTSTPTIVGNDITFTTGTITYLELSNGSKFYFDGEGRTIYDVTLVNSAYHCQLAGTLTGFYTKDWSVYSYINQYGYNLGIYEEPGGQGYLTAGYTDNFWTLTYTFLNDSDSADNHGFAFMDTQDQSGNGYLLSRQASGKYFLWRITAGVKTKIAETNSAFQNTAPQDVSWDHQAGGNNTIQITGTVGGTPNTTDFINFADGTHTTFTDLTLTLESGETVDNVILNSNTLTAEDFTSTGGGFFDEFVPASQEDFSLDVVGSQLQNQGKVRYDPEIKSSVFQFNGSDNNVAATFDITSNIDVKFKFDNYTNTGNVGIFSASNGSGLTVRAFINTTTKVLVFRIRKTDSNFENLTFDEVTENDINTFEINLNSAAGSITVNGVTKTATLPFISDFNEIDIGVISSYLPFNGRLYTFYNSEFDFRFQENEGALLYNKIQGKNNAPITGTIDGNSWQLSGLQRPFNNQEGCDVWINDTTSDKRYIPLYTDGTRIKTEGDIIAGYTWDRSAIGTTRGHNSCEMEYFHPPAPDLIIHESFHAVEIRYAESLGIYTPIGVTWDQRRADRESLHRELADIVSKYPLWFNNIVYREPQSGTTLERIYRFLKSIGDYQVIEGNYQTIEGTYKILKL
jgi:hypothetical protein